MASRSTAAARTDRKSTRLNSNHVKISYAGFCLKKKKQGLWGFDSTVTNRGVTGSATGGYVVASFLLASPTDVRRLYTPFSPIYHSNFFFKDAATTEIYTLSLHDALPI